MSGPGSNCTRNGLMATVVVGLLLSPAFAKTQHDPKPPEDNAYFTGLLGVYANQGKAGYDIFFKPTPPPDDKGLRAIAEFEDAGYLVLVYSKKSPIVEMISECIDVVPVIIVVSDNSEIEEVVKLLHQHDLGQHLRSHRVEILVESSNSPWIRDYGPIYVRRSDGTAIAMDAIYDEVRPGFGDRKQDELIPFLLGSEMDVPTYRPPLVLAGGNFSTDGQGLCFTSTATILENGGNREVTDLVFSRYFGCSEVVYLEALPGSETTKHIDMFFRIADRNTYLLGEYERRPNPSSASEYLQYESRARMERNADLLRDVAQRRNLKVKLLRVPMPDVFKTPSGGDSGDLLRELKLRAMLEGDDDAVGRAESLGQFLESNPSLAKEILGRLRLDILHRSYLNYIDLRSPNGGLVLVPNYKEDVFNGINRRKVDEVLHAAYPHARIRYIDADSLIAGAGALHCISLVVPHTAATNFARRELPAALNSDIQNADEPILAAWPDGTKKVPVREAVAEMDLLMRYQDYKSGPGKTSESMKNLLWKHAVESVLRRDVIEWALARANEVPNRLDIIARAREMAGEVWSQESLREYFRTRAQDEMELELLVRGGAFGQAKTVAEADVTDYYQENSDEFRTPGHVRLVWVRFARSRNHKSDPSPPGQPDMDAGRLIGNDFPDDEMPAWVKVAGGEIAAMLRSHPCANDQKPKIDGGPGSEWRAIESAVVSETDDKVFSRIPDAARMWAMYGLEEGEVSQPIEDDGTFLVLRLCERQDGESIPLEKVKEGIRERLQAQFVDEHREKLVESLLEGIHILDVDRPEIGR